jgi:hypothetical protein
MRKNVCPLESRKSAEIFLLLVYDMCKGSLNRRNCVGWVFVLIEMGVLFDGDIYKFKNNFKSQVPKNKFQSCSSNIFTSSSDSPVSVAMRDGSRPSSMFFFQHGLYRQYCLQTRPQETPQFPLAMPQWPLSQIAAFPSSTHPLFLEQAVRTVLSWIGRGFETNDMFENNSNTN